MEDFRIRTVLLRGLFNFRGNPDSNFKGPIRKGFRPIVWLETVHKNATSCSFVSDVEITLGETKEVEVAVLNELQLEQKIKKGTVMHVGSTKHLIGELTVTEHLGVWKNGKVP